MAKALAFYIGVLALSMGVFGLVSIFTLQASLSIKGCSILIAASLPIWTWACFKSEEPALRTLATMMIYSGMLVALFLTLLLVKLLITAPSAATAWQFASLVLAGGTFWYLRSVVVQRNKSVDKASRADAV